MVRFRRCLTAEISDRQVILHGAPSAEATAYKATVLRVFVTHGASIATKRLLLIMYPSGDWRASAVEFYVGAGSDAPPDREAVLQLLVSGLIAALCNVPPRLYPRSRWTGSDLATDDLGIF